MSRQNPADRATPTTGLQPNNTARSDPARAPVSRHGRTRLVAFALALSAMTVALLVAWRPGAGRNDFGYESVAAVRDATWATAVAAGIATATVAVAFGIATCLLVTGRGARAATIGATMASVGGIMFSGATVALGTLAWYVTEPAALPAETGAEMLTYIDDHSDRIGVLLMPGFLLFTIGSLVLAVALWRSRAVPRWWPLTFGVVTFALFAGLDERVVDVIQAGQMLLLLVVAAYAWQAVKTT